MPAARHDRQDAQGDEKRLRILTENRGPAERQKLLPLDWFDVRRPSEDTDEAAHSAEAATLSASSRPEEAVAIEIPTGHATVMHCIWQAGQHRHPGRCIPVKGPDGYEACLLIVPPESRSLILPALGLG